MPEGALEGVVLLQLRAWALEAKTTPRVGQAGGAAPRHPSLPDDSSGPL